LLNPRLDSRRGRIVGLAVGLVFGLAGPSIVTAQEPDVRTSRADRTVESALSSETGASTISHALQSEIALWIEKLGDPIYAVRLQAQSELERIGVRALDQLHRASFHPNPQIASQARFLVQSNQFSWAWETDPFPVRRILGNYSTAALYDKSAYIDQLAGLEGGEGLAALCRLVRYETHGCLAKRAALLILRSPPGAGQSLADRRQWIGAQVEGALSSAGRWVAHDAAEPIDEFSEDWWIDVLREESTLLQERSPDTSKEIVNDLTRWVVEQIASRTPRRERALALARTIPDAFPDEVPNRNQQAIEFAQWALKVSLPELVQEQHAKLSTMTLREMRFGYLLAESYLVRRDEDLASRIAALSAARIAMDSAGNAKGIEENGAEIPGMNPKLEALLQRNASQSFERSALGEYLINRGRFDWAERELRMAIEGREEDPEFATILNLTLLSQMLHEQEKHLEAAEVLRKFAERFESQPLFRSQVSEQGGDSLVSNYYLFSGDAAAAAKDAPTAKKHYIKSLELFRENVDALIGLHRLADLEPADRQEVLELQRSIVDKLRKEIEDGQRSLRQENPRFQATLERSLANQMNTLAWLLANTDGNFEEALFFSRRACALEPNRAAYLDTLAHSYAALGRFSEAVEQQKRALGLEPHQPTLQRALQRFETKLAEQRVERGTQPESNRP
jgi:hypothetical protein